MKQLHTEEQEAARIGLAPKTLANQRCRGDGPPFLKVGRLVRYDPALTDAWLSARIRHSTSEVA
ncbi:DNA-binding protein [Altererythrobacter aerius]|uniref:DNA-binding protein n=1 Tax=Tsuneonella aeria TaxID=1837929 RepID=A0A6I4TDH2_9SPHN|nr:DNA-binding protein [Tsuneonella aeria]MXO74854.1 DNA-binding protein [Tsuneonella aeria]